MPRLTGLTPLHRSQPQGQPEPIHHNDQTRSDNA